MLRPWDRLRRALHLAQRERTAEDKFREFLAYAFGIRVSDYDRMDKDLQAAINDKYAYVFLRNPLDERIRQFLQSPGRTAYCHAPGCEWRESELSAFGVLVRRCVRCEHYQVRYAHGNNAWQDMSRSDYEFLVVRDEAHRAQWDSAMSGSVAAASFDTRLRASPLNTTNGDTASALAQNEFDTAPRR